VRLVADHWTTAILPHLPADLDLRARQLGAFTRIRGLASASDLLRALLAYVLCCSSLRHLGAWAVLLDLAALSEAAWRKRLLAASAWLEWLLGELLAAPAPPLAHPGRGRVLLVDGSFVPQPRGGTYWRVHTGYDLTAGRVLALRVTDPRVGEHLSHFACQPGDVVVADGGYGYRSNLAAAVGQGAAVVLRIHPRTFPLEDEQGVAVDLLAWVSSQRGQVISRALYCRHQRQRFALRVIGVRLSAAATARAVARKRKRARRDGIKLSAEVCYLAGWVLGVTTLPAAEWPAAAVLRLYRARWQVEQFFKQLKQQLRLHRLRVVRREAAEAVLRALLISWARVERAAQHWQSTVAASLGQAVNTLNQWLVSHLLLEEVRAAVRGAWAAERGAACAEQLVRYVRSSRRPRTTQHQRLRDWLIRRQHALFRRDLRALGVSGGA
jgi:hypothetical protein